MSEELNKKSKNDSFLKMTYETECEDRTSRDIYSLAIGLTVLLGLFFSYAVSLAAVRLGIMNHFSQGTLIITIIVYLAASIGGSFIMNKTENTIACVGGFALMAFGTGLLLTVFVAAYTSASIANAFLITMGITAVMTLAATAFPKAFLSMGRMLSLALLALIIIELVVTFIFRVHQQVTDYIVILIFTGFIGFDWALAQQRPATIPNAIRSAAAIYMDVINILIRILSIIGKRRD
ncbi:MAG: US12 family protein [Clostridia bacterium]|nr:US12 family protein [Clostridia bacterium]